jgi:hypothetical protein
MGGPEVLLASALIDSGTAFESSRQEANAVRNEGKNRQLVNNQNALIARQQAIQEERAAIEQNRQFRRQERRDRSANQAIIGASGVTTEGSPLLLLEENAANAEIDSMLILREGQIKRDKLLGQAQLDEFSGRVARQSSRAKSKAILFNAKTKFGKEAFTAGKTFKDS